MTSNSYAQTKFSKVSNAPVYKPTLEEFRDPIRYVTQIRPEAEKYGIIKIIPPANFDPPFCVNSKQFKFSPRIQRLHEVDALAREKLFFKAQISRFWDCQGLKYKPLKIEKECVDEYDLQEAVDLFWDQAWDNEKRWAMVAKKLGLKTEKSVEIRKFYEKFLKPYHEFYQRFAKSKDEIVVFEDPETNAEAESKGSMQGVRKGNTTKPKKRKGTMRSSLPSISTSSEISLESTTEAKSKLRPKSSSTETTPCTMITRSSTRSLSSKAPVEASTLTKTSGTVKELPIPEPVTASNTPKISMISKASRVSASNTVSSPTTRSKTKSAAVAKSAFESKPAFKAEPKCEDRTASDLDSSLDANPATEGNASSEIKSEFEVESTSEFKATPHCDLTEEEKAELRRLKKLRNNQCCSRCHNVEPINKLDKRCHRCKRIEHHACRVIPLKHKPGETWHCYECVLALMYEQGCGFGFYDSDKAYTLHDFTQYANDFKREAFGKELNEITVGEVEQKFWEYVLREEESYDIKYGADLITSKVGSGFPSKNDEPGLYDQHYVEHEWNLNNMPLLNDSVFSHMNTHISGMMVPWVYVGMCFSTFCWHTEDHWTYSVNYNHWGEPKVWYGIPGDQAEKFEEVVREIAPHTTTFQKDVFHYMATAVNPAYLKERGVDVYTVHQHAREFVITFPRAYHSGFNCGVNFAEAVNFAPYDWLNFGRDSMKNYSNVRRQSVFSYEELMIRAADGCQTMGLEMAEIVGEHLEQVRMTGINLEIYSKGMNGTTVERPDYLSISEEFRACRYCKAVCSSMSAECLHGKVTCLSHSRFLCHDCLPEDTLLNKCHIDVDSRVLKVQARINEFRDWFSKLDDAYSMKSKHPLSYYQKLIVEGEKLKAPYNERYLKLIEDVQVYQSLVEQGEALMADKMRTRQETRAQRADTRPTSEEIESLCLRMIASPCDFGDLFSKIKERYEAVTAWQQTVITAMMLFQANINTPHLQLESLISRGESFDLRLSELDNLKKCCRILEWKTKVEQFLSWRCRINMEDEENFLTKPRHELAKISSLIKEGTYISKKYPLDYLISDMTIKFNAAVQLEEEIATLRNSKTISMELLELAWKKCRESDWCSAPAFDWLRKEYIQARAYCKECDVQELSLVEVYKQVEKCQKSPILSTTSLYKDRLVIKETGDVFTEKLASLFMKPTSYYTLGEILNEREDLIPLIEGRNVPMKIHKFSEPISEWESLTTFESFSEIQTNFDFLRDQRRKLLNALTKLNENKLVSQTCACLSMKEDSVICCLLCKAKNHVSCCRWDVFLENLPEGTYLCVRCLRSCRPSMNDVNQVCQFAHVKSTEGELVRVLAHAAKENSLRVKSTSNTFVRYKAKVWPEEFRRRAQEVVEDFLSLEISEPSVMRDVSILIKFLFKDLLDKQKGLCAKLRNASIKSNPPKVLFAEQKAKGRKSSDLDGPAKKKRLRSDQLHDDKDICALKGCVRPSVKKVGWVQCECCGCWYHLVCVGLTLEMVNAIEVYKCGTC